MSMKNDSWTQTVSALVSAKVGPIVPGAPLSACGTWGLGGPANLLISPDSLDSLCRTRRILWACNATHVVIGAGSNLLFDDRGYRGIVLRMGPALRRIDRDGNRLTVQAGMGAARLARYCEQAGLSGLEHIVGIPGTLGGLVAMNGGSLGRSVGEVVRRVRLVNPQGDLEELTRDDCRFDYRSSVFLEDRAEAVIAEVDLELAEGSTEAIRRQHRQILAERRAKYPRIRLEPNCGSVFKNNDAMHKRFGPPGKVIEDAGCKGWRIGGAMVSHRHANFITARPGTRFSDVLQLIDLVRQLVAVRTGIRMECEVRFIAADGWVGPAHLAVEAMYGRDIQYAPVNQLVTEQAEPLMAS
jgi:UDP-N-acetylmuramate dehydrogenase